jgi:hypothetical protein
MTIGLASSNKSHDFHPIPPSKKVLGMVLPGNQFEVDLDGHQFTGQAQLFEQARYRAVFGNLVNLAVNGNLYGTIHASILRPSGAKEKGDNGRRGEGLGRPMAQPLEVSQSSGRVWPTCGSPVARPAGVFTGG